MTEQEGTIYSIKRMGPVTVQDYVLRNSDGLDDYKRALAAADALADAFEKTMAEFRKSGLFTPTFIELQELHIASYRKARGEDWVAEDETPLEGLFYLKIDKHGVRVIPESDADLSWVATSEANPDA